MHFAERPLLQRIQDCSRTGLYFIMIYLYTIDYIIYVVDYRDRVDLLINQKGLCLIVKKIKIEK